MRRWAWLTLGFAACSGGGSPDAPAPPISVVDARVRAQPPGVPNSAAYMTVTNPGPATAIVGVEGDVARNIELHTHVAGEGGMMQMRRLDRIELPSGAPVSLAPGGLHVMLIGLTRDLLPGQSVTLQLRLADGRQHAVVAPVEALPGLPAAPASPAPGDAAGTPAGAADGR